jgi:hypothetical protein
LHLICLSRNRQVRNQRSGFFFSISLHLKKIIYLQPVSHGINSFIINNITNF